MTLVSRSFPARRSRRGAAWLAAALALLPHVPAFGQSRCTIPHELIDGGSALPASTGAIERHQPLKIVAIGGASTAGSGASAPTAAYPMRLQAHLGAHLPGHAVAVVNRSVPRQTAAEMAARLQADVLAERPTLVIWETGTVDAVRGVDLDQFNRTLADGIARLRAAGADVILVDPQYSPRTMALINLRPYFEAMHMTGDGAGVEVFNRFDVMEYWADQHRFDMTVKPPALTAEIDAIYDCIGAVLAQLITDRLVSEGAKGLR